MSSYQSTENLGFRGDVLTLNQDTGLGSLKPFPYRFLSAFGYKKLSHDVDEALIT